MRPAIRPHRVRRPDAQLFMSASTLPETMAPSSPRVAGTSKYRSRTSSVQRTGPCCLGMSVPTGNLKGETDQKSVLMGKWKLSEWNLGEWNLGEWKKSEWKNSDSIFADFHKLLNSTLAWCSRSEGFFVLSHRAFQRPTFPKIKRTSCTALSSQQHPRRHSEGPHDRCHDRVFEMICRRFE